MAKVWIHLIWVIMLCCGSQVSYLGRVIGCFSPLEAYMIPSGSMKTGPHGDGFQINSSTGPLGSMSQAHSVFSNMFLPSTSVEQPREITIAYNVFGVSYTTLTYISKEGFSCLDLDVLCQIFFTLAVLSARQKDPVELYMNVYTKIYIYQKYFG